MTTDMTYTEALENAVACLREIHKSFTSPEGALIEDTLSQTEWRLMSGALDHVDAAALAEER